MIKIAKLSLVVFTLLITQLTHVHAEKIQVVLHDQQIKLFLARQGLNFDMHCEMEAPDSDDKKTGLITLIRQIFNDKKFNPSYFLFPENEDDLLGTLYGTFKIPELDAHDGNGTNQQFFNTLLEENNIFSQVIESSTDMGEEESQLSFDDVYQAIGDAIISYLCQVDQSSAHLYIKVILDTEAKTVTILAAPHQNQDGFVCTYEKAIIENIVAQVEGKKAHKFAKNLMSSKKSARSCFGAKTVILGVTAIGLATYAAYNLDLMDVESLTSFYDETFNQ